MKKQNAIMKITQKDLIQEIVNDFKGKYDKKTVTDVIIDLQENIVKHLKSATKDNPVAIRPFMGMIISSKIIDEQEVTLNGKSYIRSERLKALANVTRYFNRIILNKLN